MFSGYTGVLQVVWGGGDEDVLVHCWCASHHTAIVGLLANVRSQNTHLTLPLPAIMLLLK